MSSSCDEKRSHCSPEYWIECWEKQDIGFHQLEVHRHLNNHFDKLKGDRSQVRILLPLSGKSLDIKWLADQGCEVVGVELSELAVDAFFKEQSLEHTVVSNPYGKVFQCTSLPITIYCCNFFDIQNMKPGLFNAVWDTGGLCAINDRKRYSDVLKSLFAPDVRYLVDVFEYPDELFSGPPNTTRSPEIESLYGDKCVCELIEKSDVGELRNRVLKRIDSSEDIFEYFNSCLYLITPRP